MKTLLLLVISTLALHSAPMGSINDPVLSPAPSSLQSQINALQADIDQRNKILSHEKTKGTHGAYQDIVDAEVKQIAALKAQIVK